MWLHLRMMILFLSLVVIIIFQKDGYPEVYKYKDLRHTKGSKITHGEEPLHKSLKTNTLPKLSSKNIQPKPKLSVDQTRSTPLKNQQALVPIPSRLCCKLKTCNDVRFKIKSPRPLNQQNPKSTSPLS